MHGLLTTGIAIALSSLVSSIALAESVLTPANLRTQQISAGVEHESLSDFVVETFTNASEQPESIGAHINVSNQHAQLSVQTIGSLEPFEPSPAARAFADLCGCCGLC